MRERKRKRGETKRRKESQGGGRKRRGREQVKASPKKKTRWRNMYQYYGDIFTHSESIVQINILFWWLYCLTCLYDNNNDSVKISIKSWIM